MAKLIVGPTTKITVNGVDLSDHCSSYDLGGAVDEIDVTGSGETWREFQPGLKDSSWTLSFFDDYAASSVDATLYPLFANNTAGTYKVTPDTNGTVVYTMVAKIYNYPFFNGGVGDASTKDVTIRNAGTAGPTRGTS